MNNKNKEKDPENEEKTFIVETSEIVIIRTEVKGVKTAREAAEFVMRHGAPYDGIYDSDDFGLIGVYDATGHTLLLDEFWESVEEE